MNMRKKPQISFVFEEAKNIITDKSGKCLTEAAYSQYDKIQVMCDQGHIWETNSKMIKIGHWCDNVKCRGARISKTKINATNKILEVIDFCKNKGGKCLSTEYKGRRSPLLFECELGHQWKSNWANILNGSWCHFCAKVKFFAKANTIPPISLCKYTIDDVKQIAIEKGGQCISNEYKSRMRFICAFGHEWEATSGNIIGRNSWCPTCSSSLYERICRLYFETIFSKKFPTTYPKWLINENGHQLELDGYCEELLLAFEHNGAQHYNQVKFRGRIYDFEKLQQNDKIKIQLCKENNIKLIIIPELFSRTKINDLKEFIATNYVNLGGNLPNNYDEIVIDYKLVYFSNKEEKKFLELKEKLFLKGYELLSNEYLGCNFKYNVRCINCNTVKNTIYSNLLLRNCVMCQAITNKIKVNIQ
jgi:hypothetical protein